MDIEKQIDFVRSNLKPIGVILTIASLIYIAFIIKDSRFEIILVQNQSYFSLISTFIFIPALCVITLFINSFSWKLILEFLSQKPIGMIDIVNVYFRSNIAKYFPGNVLQYASRNFLGSKFHWDQKEIFFSSFLELLLNTLFIILVLSGFVFFQKSDLNSLDVFINYKKIYLYITIVVIAFIGLLLWSKKSKQLNAFILKIRTKHVSVLLLKYFLFFILNFFIGSVLTIWVFDIYTNIPLTLSNTILIIEASTVSFFIGFIAIGSPAGIGVRESLMIVLLSSVGSPASILSALIILRITGILGDIIAYFFIVALAGKHLKQPQ